ncbi:lysophospholipid acyltransferase family protein [Nitrospirota bacterium]
MRHLAEYIALAFAALPFVILPRRFALRCGEAFGLLCFLTLKRRRAIAVGNLSAVQRRGLLSDKRPPELIARDCFRNIGRTFADIARMSYGIDRDQVEKVRIEGMEHVEAAMNSGRGYIMVTGHFANWELVAMASAPRLSVATAVARRQKNPYLDRLVIRNRKSRGSEVVYKEGAIKQFMSALNEGRGVGMILDEPVSPEAGTPVEFLGLSAGFHKTLYSLSKRYGAPVLPFFTRYDGSGGYVMKILPELEMSGSEIEDTQRVASVLEGFILENPTEWLQWFRKWTWARERDEGTVT